MIFNLPHTALRLVEKLEASGFSAYVVGGCVRDSLMGITPNDYDICTSALPEEMKLVFKNFKVIETGIKHGTLTVLAYGDSFEVTTFRSDGQYSDNRRPDSVIFHRSLERDLARRDFTVNAMAYNNRNGLFDPFHGAEDIKNKIIKTVGDAGERFNEDALRILRALFFSSKFGFDIDPSTARAIHQYNYLLNNIASERISKELRKILSSQFCKKILKEYFDVFSVFIPELVHKYTEPEWCLMADSLESFEDDFILRLTLFILPAVSCARNSKQSDAENDREFFRKISFNARKILKRLKFDNKTIGSVCVIIENINVAVNSDRPSVKRALRNFGKENLIRILKIKSSYYAQEANYFIKYEKNITNSIFFLIDSITKYNECYELKTLAISGDEILETLDIQRPEHVGAVLSELLERVIDGKIINNKKILLEVVGEIYLHILSINKTML